MSSSYQSNGQVEACIKFIKQSIEKCIDTRSDIHIALLQIRSTPLGSGLPNPAMLLFNHQIMGIVPIVNRPPINSNNDDENFEALVKRPRMTGTMIPPETMPLFC